MPVALLVLTPAPVRHVLQELSSTAEVASLVLLTVSTALVAILAPHVSKVLS